MKGFAARLGIQAGEIAKSAGAFAHYGVKQAGKGIISNSEAVDTRYSKEYNLRKEELFNDLKSRIDLNHSSASNMMRKIIAQLDASNDLIDINSYNGIRDDILKEIAKDEAEYKKRVDKLNDDLQKANSAMLDDIQDHEDKSDEMWKYRALSMFLVLTPFGAFSIAGHVLNYLDPLAEIFGPLFDAHKSMGEGMGDVVTSDKFGFLGDTMGAMKVDVAIETIIDKTPIISQFFDAINTLTDSQIGQNVMAEAAPLLSSPLLLLGIGGSYALSRAPEELAHSKGKKDSEKKHGKALEDLFTDFGKEVTDGWVEEKSDKSIVKHQGSNDILKALAIKQLEQRKLGNIDSIIQKFFVENFYKPSSKPFLKAIFGDDKLNGKTMLDLADEGKFSRNGVMSLEGLKEATKKVRDMKGYNEYKESIREKFLLLSAIDPSILQNGVIDLSEAPETLAQFQRLSDPASIEERQQKQKKAKEKFDQEFIFAEADRSKISYKRNPKNDDEIAKRIEVTLKEKEIENLKKYLGTGNPSTVIPTENLTVTKLRGTEIGTARQ